jgi:Protein of unknown function (DUF3014)
MNSSTKTIIAVFSVLIIIVAVVYFVWIRPGVQEEVVEIVETVPIPEPTPTPTLAERLSERLVGTTLRTSDVIVRELVSELSANPKLAAWLANEDLVRRFVAAVDNTANGISPTTQLDFMRPKGKFKVVTKGDVITIDPKSYARYDLATQVFVSLDTEGSAALYRELEPLIDDAYAEISPPGSRFSDRLDAAIEELLEVTPPSGKPELKPKVVTYVYVDESLENLSAAQRQLLRMGPDNAMLIKAKLRDLQAALQTN